MGRPPIVALLAAVVLVSACAGQPAPQQRPPARPVALATPAPPVRMDLSTSCGIPGVREKVLQRANAARAAARSCGGQPMPAAPPLRWSDPLFSAAARHSRDMARQDYFDHVDPAGKRVGARASAEGYAWRGVAENIAAGDGSVEKVMQGWLDSPGHCRNIMNPDYTDIAVACVERSGSTWGTYWTMVLGRPR